MPATALKKKMAIDEKIISVVFAYCSKICQKIVQAAIKSSAEIKSSTTTKLATLDKFCR